MAIEDTIKAIEDRIKAIEDRKVVYAELALYRLRTALDYAKLADCPRVCKRIRLAISSAKGGVRAAEYRASRARAKREV